MSKHPYTPLGTNVLLRSPNPRVVGSIIVPDNVQAPSKPTFELCAVASDVTVISHEDVGSNVFIKPGGTLLPFPADKDDEHFYYIVDEKDLAAIVN